VSDTEDEISSDEDSDEEGSDEEMDVDDEEDEEDEEEDNGVAVMGRGGRRSAKVSGVADLRLVRPLTSFPDQGQEGCQEEAQGRQGDSAEKEAAAARQGQGR